MEDSKVFGMSLRGLICIILTLTVCLMSGMDKKIIEPLYSAFLLALGFYFGQKNQQSTNGGNGNEKTTISVGDIASIKPITGGSDKP